MDKTPYNTVDSSFLIVENFINNASVASLINHMKIKFKNWREKVSPEEAACFIAFQEQFGFWGALNPELNKFGMIEERSRCLKNHMADLSDLYFSLADYRSRSTFLGLIMYWLDFDIDKFNQYQERHYDTYFDLDLMQCDANEVFVDAGAFDGETVYHYISNYGKNAYKRIICYDINQYNLELLKKNLSELENLDVRLKGVTDTNGVMYTNFKDMFNYCSLTQDKEGNFSIPLVTLDDDITEPITFLKMDIEGAEYSALAGAKNHIINDRPKMAISIYHSNDDLWRIFNYLNSICVNYKYYFRFNAHGPESVNPQTFPADYILLCVPQPQRGVL